MEIINLQQLIIEKKIDEFTNRCHEIVNSKNILEITSIYKYLISVQSIVPENIFYKFWKFFLENGKLKLSTECAEIYFKKNCKNKRICKMQLFVNELKTQGTSKDKVEKYLQVIKSILGDKKAYSEINEKEYVLDWHEEYWGNKREIEKKIILEMYEYNIEKIKAIYEFILKYGFDEEILLILKDNILTETKYKQDYIKLMKININPSKEKINYENNDESLKIDYDQLAYEIISGKKENLSAEESRVIKSLEFLTNEELLEKGREMLVAFRFLQMHEVVINLAIKLEALFTKDIDKAGIKFLKIQTQIEAVKYYEALDSLESVLSTMPLLNSEKLEFLKLKKQIYQVMKNTKDIKTIDNEIKSLTSDIMEKEQTVT